MGRMKDIALPAKIIVRKRKPKDPNRISFAIPGAPQMAAFRWKPGQSGNPSGRPKFSGQGSISQAYTVALNGLLPDNIKHQYGLEDGATWADLIAKQMIMRAVNEAATSAIDMAAVLELREVTEGKLVEKKELAGANGAPLTAPSFNINFKEPDNV